MIRKSLQYLIPSLNEHPTDDRLARLLCHELPLIERLISRQHLAQCWLCRVRQKDLKGRANRMVSVYRDALKCERLLLPASRRTEFVGRLELHIQQASVRKWNGIHFPKKLSQLPAINTALAGCAALSFVTAIILFILLWQQHQPTITSNALLVRAEERDISRQALPTGVIYQSLRITTPVQTMERSIYRDLEGKRSPKSVKLARKQEELKAQLAQAGVNWEEPISASDYQAWHDHQHERADKIVYVGAHLLRLTTTVTDSSVPSQSLTVRETDFHPVQRTVVLRDIGEVEIAELDFKILPWSAVGADIFEPIGGVSTRLAVGPARILQLPKLQQSVTPEQLDESELSARLVLNQLHADNGEQIEIHRLRQGVEVEGVVETDERKRELQTQLRIVPHLVVAIQSEADLKNAPLDGNTANIKTASMPDHVSPLEMFLREHGRGVEEINSLAQQFFSLALMISQESKAIIDLQTRFSFDGQRTIVASATLAELIYSHREKLEAALKRQRALVAEMQATSEFFLNDTPSSRAPTLRDAADKNLVLSKDLTQTDSPATRTAEQIFTEMSASMDDLAVAAHNVYGKSQGESALSGKK